MSQQRKTVKMLDAEVKGLRQELLRLKAEVATLKSSYTRSMKTYCIECGAEYPTTNEIDRCDACRELSE